MKCRLPSWCGDNVCMLVSKPKHGCYPWAKAFLWMLQLGEAFVEQCVDHLSWVADTRIHEHPARTCRARGQQGEQNNESAFVSVLKSMS